MRPSITGLRSTQPAALAARRGRSPAAAAGRRRPRSSARPRAGRSAARLPSPPPGGHGDDRGDRGDAPARRPRRSSTGAGAWPARRSPARARAAPARRWSFSSLRLVMRRTLSTASSQSCGGRVRCMTPARPRLARHTQARRRTSAVVGAGMAGLAAAHRAEARAARSFVVLEARDRVGGPPRVAGDRSRTAWIDVGGQWVGPTQDRLYALAREHGAADLPDLDRGRERGRDGRPADPLHGHDPTPAPARAGGRRPGDAAARPDGRRRCRSRRPGTRRRREQWDSQTVWSWMRRNMATRGGPRDDGDRREGGLGRDARRTCRCCTSSSTSPRPASSTCCSTPRAARSRTASSRARAPGRAASATALGDRLVAVGAGAPHRVDGRTAARVHADGVEVRARRVIVAVPPTLAGRHRVRPAAARATATSSRSACRWAR